MGFSSVMSLTDRQQSPPKRPRLSLQTPTLAVQPFGRSSTTSFKANIDPSSPTAFNTLSNAYAVAIGNASPLSLKPLAVPCSAQSSGTKLVKPTSLRLETMIGAGDGYKMPSQHTQTPGPFSITYPDTPSSAFPDESTPTLTRPQFQAAPPQPCTFTPPQSAGSTDCSQSRVFTFTANTARAVASSPRTPRRRATIGSQWQVAPYTHPKALHSILRNSPLPPRTSMTPETPTRMSLRIATRAEKKVGYNNPLTQTITTNKYVRSHIDLLCEDSPRSANEPQSASSDILEQTMEYTGDETRDGGHTPGPFEEMRRRMANSGLETPARKKRKQREKKRKWEWTITNTEGVEQDLDINDETKMQDERTPVTAIMTIKTPITAKWRDFSVSDTEMSDVDDSKRSFSVESLTDSELSQDERPGTSQSL